MFGHLHYVWLVIIKGCLTILRILDSSSAVSGPELDSDGDIGSTLDIFSMSGGQSYSMEMLAIWGGLSMAYPLIHIH